MMIPEGDSHDHGCSLALHEFYDEEEVEVDGQA